MGEVKTASHSLGLVFARRFLRTVTAQVGSSTLRRPALDLGSHLMISPCPMIRITVPRTSTIPGCGSSDSHRVTSQHRSQEAPVSRCHGLTFPRGEPGSCNRVGGARRPF